MEALKRIVNKKTKVVYEVIYFSLYHKKAMLVNKVEANPYPITIPIDSYYSDCEVGVVS